MDGQNKHQLCCLPLYKCSQAQEPKYPSSDPNPQSLLKSEIELRESAAKCTQNARAFPSVSYNAAQKWGETVPTPKRVGTPLFSGFKGKQKATPKPFWEGGSNLKNNGPLTGPATSCWFDRQGMRDGATTQETKRIPSIVLYLFFANPKPGLLPGLLSLRLFRESQTRFLPPNPSTPGIHLAPRRSSRRPDRSAAAQRAVPQQDTSTPASSRQ